MNHIVQTFFEKDVSFAGSYGIREVVYLREFLWVQPVDTNLASVANKACKHNGQRTHI